MSTFTKDASSGNCSKPLGRSHRFVDAQGRWTCAKCFGVTIPRKEDDKPTRPRRAKSTGRR